MPIVLEPIGHVRTDASRDEVKADRTVLSTIEVTAEHEPALEGIDGFSHLLVLCFLHRLPPEARALLQVRPRGLLRYGLTEEDLPTIGVFASDSPARPNPIGVSVVEVVAREGRSIRVRGLDVFDGTPVLDIKPYTPDRSVPDVRTPEWYADLIRRSGSDRV